MVYLKILEDALEDWKRFYLENGRRESFTNCEGYRTLRCLSFDALPFLREIYDRDSARDRGLASVKRDLHRAVGDIVGEEFEVPPDILGDETRVSAYTMRWLDENVRRFFSALGFLTFEES